jgi:hypothetical protein
MTDEWAFYSVLAEDLERILSDCEKHGAGPILLNQLRLSLNLAKANAHATGDEKSRCVDVTAEVQREVGP